MSATNKFFFFNNSEAIVKTPNFFFVANSIVEGKKDLNVFIVNTTRCQAIRLQDS